MNILFVTAYDVSPQKGGTERVIHSLSNGLCADFGVKCYLAYYDEIEKHYERTSFNGKIRLVSGKQIKLLSDSLISWKIDVILVEGLFNEVKRIRHLIEVQHLFCKLIFVHHFSPGYEFHFYDFHRMLPRSRKWRDVMKSGMKIILYPCLRIYSKYEICRRYQNAYKYADRIVLLSRKHISAFRKVGRINSETKFSVIHNMLSYNEFFKITDFHLKRREIIIVSRLEEEPKRISLALHVWYEIEKIPDLKDWILIIVGSGTSENYYFSLARKLKLQRVVFKGVQEPLNYYRQASVFMMTSASESWGLVLTEAQQMGVVPIAFDSYPTACDIIESGVNGYLIPDKDLDTYECKLVELMRDEQLRRMLAKNAIGNSKRFLSEIIIRDWNQLLAEVCNEA